MLVRWGKIVPQGRLGRLYIGATTIGCLTALGLSKQGGLNPGHALALLTMLCLAGAVISEYRQVKGWRYLQVGLLSTSLFFSLVPAINETLTRLPLSHPLATGPTDPLVQKSLGVLAFVFAVTLVTQFVFVRRNQNRMRDLSIHVDSAKHGVRSA